MKRQAAMLKFIVPSPWIANSVSGTNGRLAHPPAMASRGAIATYPSLEWGRAHSALVRCGNPHHVTERVPIAPQKRLSQIAQWASGAFGNLAKRLAAAAKQPAHARFKFSRARRARRALQRSRKRRVATHRLVLKFASHRIACGATGMIGPLATSAAASEGSCAELQHTPLAVVQFVTTTLANGLASAQENATRGSTAVGRCGAIGILVRCPVDLVPLHVQGS